MDIFIERSVQKKKDYLDYIIILATILFSFISAYIIISIAGPYYFGIGLAFVVLLGSIGYLIITSRNIEYEYALTNGDLDISKIVAKRKRKRVFYGNCKQFEMIGTVSSDQHRKAISGVMTKIHATSLINPEDEYFFIANYNKKRVVVYFEPDSKILDAIRTMNKKAFL